MQNLQAFDLCMCRQLNSCALVCRWAVATAVCCNQVGLSSQLGTACRALLEDPPAADVAFELQSPLKLVWAHTPIIAASCSKLYDAILHQQQQQEQELQPSYSGAQSQTPSAGRSGASSSRMTAVRLGKQVAEQPFRQVLHYIYTGQVPAIRPAERSPLQRYAQALGLEQLAALVGGASPMPGAVYTPFSLALLMPQQPVITSHVPSSGMSAMDSVDASQHSQQQTGCQPQPQLALHGGLNHFTSDTDVPTTAESEPDSPAQPGIHSRQHPALQDLTNNFNLALGRQLPSRMAVPSSMPAHADVLVVPALRLPLMPHAVCPTAYMAIRPGCIPQHEGTDSDGDDHAGLKSATCKVGSKECLMDQAAGTIVGLSAHSAVLMASSAYFSAMLSDRWQAATEAGSQQQKGRSLPVAHLLSHDVHVVLCLLHFCYTHELCLESSLSCVSQADGLGGNAAGAVSGLGPFAVGSDVCACCWKTRTAVRLAAAAEELIVPELHQLCLRFVEKSQQQLPDVCRHVVLSDMTQLHHLDPA